MRGIDMYAHPGAIATAGSPSTCPAALRCFDASLSSELPCMLK